MFTRRILLPAAIVLSALTIGGTTAGVAVAASSQGHFSADLPAHPAHSLTVQVRQVGLRTWHSDPLSEVRTRTPEREMFR